MHEGVSFMEYYTIIIIYNNIQQSELDRCESHIDERLTDNEWKFLPSLKESQIENWSFDGAVLKANFYYGGW